MASDTQHLIFIYLSVCVLLSVGFKVNYLRYCGPPDKTFKYKITPWPELKPGQPVNITFSFTPKYDIFTSTLEYVVTKNGKLIMRGTANVKCKDVPQICNLAVGELYTFTYHYKHLRPIPPGFKGTFYGNATLYNQDQHIWSCFEVEVDL